MPLSEAEKWLQHLGSCSPCYADFSTFQAAHRGRRTRTLLAVAASILIVAGLAGWVFLLRPKEPLVAGTAVVDLRDRSIPRGTEPNPAQPPLEIARNVSHLEIYLPLGSPEGPYDVRIVSLSGESLLTTGGKAKLNDHITLLQVAVNLSSARPGRYVLQVRRTGSEWNAYPLFLREL